MQNSIFVKWIHRNSLPEELLSHLMEELSGDAWNFSPTLSGDNSLLDINAEAAWVYLGEVFSLWLPELSQYVGDIVENQGCCLIPSDDKNPLPYTYDCGYGKLPFISLHFKQRVGDLICLAHEFSHALQIVASQRRCFSR